MTTTENPRDGGLGAGPALRSPATEPLSSGSPPRRKGVFEPRRVRFLSFVVIAIGLFVTAMLCILAIWDYASRDTAWRALATLGVVAGTMFIFTVINEMFGAHIDA